MAETLVGSSLIKQLASCNRGTRDKALNALLKKWIPTQKQIDDDDMKKLWKGIFYCVWHADKLPVQTELIERVSSLLPFLDIPIAVHYFSVFLLTMRREWTGIDGLRLDKFYLLIRRFLHYFFEFLRKHSWDVEFSKRLMNVLMEKSLLADDKFHGNGVNYHIVSIFVEELRPFLPLRKEVLEEIFVPFVSVMGKVQDKVLLGKIKSNVFDELLQMGKRLLETKKSGNEIDSGDEVVLLGLIALVMGFSAKFFELGSSTDCCQGNRKVLFSLHEEFGKLEKDLGSSGIDISIPDVNVDVKEDDVPNLVPITTEMEMDGSDDNVVEASTRNVLKNCKKAKKDKKSKKKKKKNASTDPGTDTSNIGEEEENVVSENCNMSVDEQSPDANLISFNESVISNLQMQFEKVAAEVGLDNNVESACGLPKLKANGTASKKRKRVKNKDGRQLQNPGLIKEDDTDGCLTAKSGEKSSKKVRFSMKNNLVWKPQSPLPPQSLRLPPSVAPRGSALKKGVPPGPVREMPLASKKVKQRAKSVKKARKVIKIINPALKGAKKLKSLST
ncbi:ribosomal RNA processing protein 1-like [Melia azedarach]|uniref:Ribosomal RNA processing protein 1-like n=1 Tax=Melia azedarach TaxID=155640 RepID=A0ACC1XDI2_MELAZ|nr:ribosomal RNA processing protein 1-like [Melia azedarach]